MVHHPHLGKVTFDVYLAKFDSDPIFRELCTAEWQQLLLEHRKVTPLPKALRQPPCEAHPMGTSCNSL